MNHAIAPEARDTVSSVEALESFAPFQRLTETARQRLERGLRYTTFARRADILSRGDRVALTWS